MHSGAGNRQEHVPIFPGGAAGHRTLQGQTLRFTVGAQYRGSTRSGPVPAGLERLGMNPEGRSTWLGEQDTPRRPPPRKTATDNEPQLLGHPRQPARIENPNSLPAFLDIIHDVLRETRPPDSHHQRDLFRNRKNEGPPGRPNQRRNPFLKNHLCHKNSRMAWRSIFRRFGRAAVAIRNDRRHFAHFHRVGLRL